MKQPNSSKSISIVIGLGRSGIGAARLLHSTGKKVLILEKSINETLIKTSLELKKEGIDVELGKELEMSSFNPWIKNIESIIISPSIPWDHIILRKLKTEGIEIKSEISLAWETLNNIPWVGITGTNGKTTVTHMLNHILQTNEIYAPMGGNVGKAATEIALNIKSTNQQKPAWLIMELSSYQIETAPQINPKIGIWTTLTPDHLERHKSLENYYNIKRSLIDNSSIRIYNADDSFLREHREKLLKGIWVSCIDQQKFINKANIWINNKGYVIEEGKELFNSSKLQIRGEHNLQNLLLVTAAARQIGISAKQIERGISSFKGVPHRLEGIGKISNINIINDSKATNYASAETGLKAVLNPSIVIAGGQIKKGSASSWLKMLKNKSSGVVLFGESAQELNTLIIKSKYKGKILCCKDLKESVENSISLAFDTKAKTILLSPACASFDQYKNFEERGNHFKEIVNLYLKNFHAKQSKS